MDAAADIGIATMRGECPPYRSPDAFAYRPPPLTKITYNVSSAIMNRTAPHSARTEHPAPPQGRAGKAVPPCIAAILSVVRVLLGYAKHLERTLPDRAEHPRFPTLAAGFGTHDMRRILDHVQRGILRAMMLQRFLLARAAQGRDIEPTEPAERANPADIEALEIKLRPPAAPREKAPRRPHIDPDHPAHFHMPTLQELEAQVRRRSVGRTIAEICMDLGVAAMTCDGGFWIEIYRTMTNFGGSFERTFAVQERRRAAFEKERSKLPHTWKFDWRDRPQDAIRQLLGTLLGEPPPPQLLSADPA